MATKLGDALLYLGADDDKLKRDLDGAEKKTKGWGATMTGIAQGFGMGIFGAISSGIQGAFSTIGESIGLASDFGETVSKVRTLFGDSAAGIEEWAATSISALRLTSQESLDAVGTMGNMFMQMGVATKEAAAMSQSMVQLAADIASFHNVEGGAVEVSEALQAAYRGEYDSLQRYIPLINAAAVEQRALADTGKAAASELTAQEKALAVYNLTIEGAGAAVGDAARTGESFAGAMTIVNKYWTEFKTLLGETLLPILTPLVAKIAELANDYLPVLADYLRTSVIPAFEAWAENFDSWWAEHGQPFLDEIEQMWQDIVAAATLAMGETETEFGLNLESMNAIAEVLGTQIGTSLGNAIGDAVETWWDGWWERFWSDRLARLQSGNWFAGPSGVPALPSPAPQSLPGSGGNGSLNSQSYGGMPQAVGITVNVDASNRGVADAARDGTLDALRAAGMR